MWERAAFSISPRPLRLRESLIDTPREAHLAGSLQLAQPGNDQAAPAVRAQRSSGRDGHSWRIFLPTEKSGQPVFLPVPSDVKAALDALPIPKGAVGECRYGAHPGSDDGVYSCH